MFDEFDCPRLGDGVTVSKATRVANIKVGAKYAKTVRIRDVRDKRGGKI